MIESHLHPVLSSIPFALISLAVGAEMWAAIRRRNDLYQIVTVSLSCAVGGILAAFLSGYLAADFGHATLNIAADTIAHHHLWGKFLLFIGVVTLIANLVAQHARYNRNVFTALFRLLLVSLWILSMITGFLGGDMLLSPDNRTQSGSVKQLNE